MGIKGAEAGAIVSFIIFAAFFSFISVSSSVFFLDGDMCNIGNWALNSLYPENFSCDPILSKDHVYYLKPHMFMVESLMRLTGSYIGALKILMLIQISLTLVTTFYMLRGLFGNISVLCAAAVSFFITMVYIKAPVFECVGFIDLRSASARSTFSIFIPLFILYYFKGRDPLIRGFRLPRIFIIAAAAALLFQLHPQTCITLFATLLLHWLIVNRSSFNRKMLPIIIPAGILFSIGIYLFMESFSHSTFRMGSLEYIGGKIFYLFNMNQGFRGKFFTLNSFWLLQLTFLPYVFAALVMLFFYGTLPADRDDRKLFLFLRGIFFLAIILHITLGFAGYHFISLSQIGLESIFMRSTKFILFVLELLALFYILKGRCFVKSRFLHALSSVSIVFCLFMMSGSRLDLQGETLKWIFSSVPVIDESNDIKYNIIFKLPVIAGLLLLLMMTTLKWEKEFWKNTLIIYCSVIMLLMPFASKAVKMKAGDFMDSTAGLGSWSILEKLISSSCAAELRSFEDARRWTTANTKPETMVFTMMKPADGQKFKIASLRPGVGDIDDGCIMNTGPALQAELAVFYQALKENPQNADKIILGKMNKYNCRFLLVHKKRYSDLIPVIEKKLPIVHSNECYNIYKKTPLEQNVENKTGQSF